eukprot:Phypoly_transcript_20329.p1 GENE.Phypoly_transcript_20329~~Phypoly_transcript_20329.p1  ORF type:complete len:193 (+),score=22.96 Phypoly_transcript_20329:89-667(+)
MASRIHIIVTAIVAVIAFALVIVSWATNWYTVSGTQANIHFKYYWSHLTITIAGDSLSTDYLSNSHTKKIFDSSLSFLTIGGVALLAFIAATALNLLFKDSKIVKLLVIAAGIVSIVFFCISFFTFLGINKAFHDDGVCGPDAPGGKNDDYCHKFVGKSGNEKWNGGPGFWVLLGAIVLTIGASLSALKAVL